MIEIRNNYRPKNDELNALNKASWAHEHHYTDYSNVLDRSLGHICAFKHDEMVGFVNVAWDGGDHAFILDTCVTPNLRNQGIGLRMVEMAVGLAKSRGAKWLHVDFEPHLEEFYRRSGFGPTKAGLIDLTS